jgi:hypothetical protein
LKTVPTAFWSSVQLTVKIHPRFIVVVFMRRMCRSEDEEGGVDLDLSVAKGAAERWSDREQQRDARLSAIREGRISDVESPERIKKRLDRLTGAALKQKRRGSAAVPAG